MNSTKTVIIRYTESRCPNRHSEFRKQAKTLCFQWIITDFMITRWVMNLLGQYNTRLADIVTYKTSDSSHTLSAHYGLVAVVELIKRLGLSSMIARLLPRRGSNRAYPASIFFKTLMRMLHDGARCLADVRLLKQESALMGMILPSG